MYFTTDDVSRNLDCKNFKKKEEEILVVMHQMLYNMREVFCYLNFLASGNGNGKLKKIIKVKVSLDYFTVKWQLKKFISGQKSAKPRNKNPQY